MIFLTVLFVALGLVAALVAGLMAALNTWDIWSDQSNRWIQLKETATAALIHFAFIAVLVGLMIFAADKVLT